MFSADFRRAVAAEAAGDYNEAARAYALAGEHAKVAEMHLLRAERAPSPEARLQELRAAVRWADPEDENGRAARRRIARARFVWAKQAGVVSEADRAVVREAAQLFAESNDHSGAGECHELLGDELQAAEAYQRAGDLERLESVLSREEVRRRHKHRVTDAYEEYRLQLAAGERDLAALALRVCVEGSAEPERSGYRRELEALEARLLTDGTVRLAVVGAAGDGGRDTLYAGAFPLSLGREAICHVVLRDAGISRRHCEVVLSGGKFALRDLHSKNGVILGGVPVAPGGTLPLDGEGELGVGEHCGMRFHVAPVAGGALLTLEVVRGLDRGLRILASQQPFTLGTGAHALTLAFRDGRPRLQAKEALSLNQSRAGTNVQLCRGDKIELGPLKVEVR